MGLLQWDFLKRQAENTVRRQVNRETAELRRDLSLVRQAARMSRRAGEAAAAAARRPRRSTAAGELEPETPPEECGPVVCADGYVRRSPVQPYRTPAGYRRRLRRRGILIAAAAVVVVLLAVAVLGSGWIRI